VRFSAARDHRRSAAGPSGRLPRFVRQVSSQGPECLGEIDREPSLRAHPDAPVLRVFVRILCGLDIAVAHVCAEVPVGERTKITRQLRRLRGHDGALHADVLVWWRLCLRAETEAAGTRELSHFYAVALMVGFAYGGVMPRDAILVREYFGARIMGTTFGAVGFASTLSMALGPLAGDWLYEAFGSSAWLCIGSCGIGIGAMAIACTFRPPRSLPAARPSPIVAH
jgi:hypothetical protein